MTQRFLLLSIVLLAGSLLLGRTVSAYSDTTTHPAITDQIVDLYNQSYPNDKITPEEKEWIIQGSILEDTPPRWINHFYDPVSGLGWTGEEAGKIAAEEVRKASKVALSSNDPVSALDWLNNYALQQSYDFLGGNRTWLRANQYFAEGNRREAYISLGHILHLLEDMGVPDHTRNDTHAEVMGSVTEDPGSPLENYAAQWNRSNIGKLNLVSILTGTAIPSYREPVEYLMDTAQYSNRRFFSRDTIGKYPEPKVLEDDGVFAYGEDELGKFPIALVNSVRTENNSTIKEYTLKEEEKYVPILAAYFPRLASKIILNGAGLIHLFMEQSRDAAVNEEYYGHDTRYQASKAVSRMVMPNFSIVGYLGQASRFIQSLGRGMVGGVVSGFSWLTDAFHLGTGPSANIADVFGGNTPPPPAPSSPQSVEEAPGVIREVMPSLPVATPLKNSPSPEDQLAALLRQLEELQARLRTNQVATSTSTSSTSSAPLVFWAGAGAGPVSGGGSSGGVVLGASTPPSPANTPAVNHAVIGEIQVAGADAGDEFIELYNPTDHVIDLSLGSIQYLGGNAEDIGSVKKKNFEEGSAIAPYGYFLVARGKNASGTDGYTGAVTADLAHRTFAFSGGGGTVFLVADQEEITGADDEDIIDRVAYGTGTILLGEGSAAPAPASGESIERQALASGNCRVAEDTDEFSGNGCDTGRNADDFALRSVAKGQGRANMPEPRPAPTPSDVMIAYAFAPGINASWTLAMDAEGATGTVRYILKDTTNTSSATELFNVTAKTAESVRLLEVGRDYALEFSAADRDGLAAITTSTIHAASFFDSIRWYRDDRPGHGGYLLDLTTTSSRPLADLLSPSTNRDYRLLVAYVNQEPLRTPLLTSGTHFDLGESADVLAVSYSTCYGGNTLKPQFLVAFNQHSCQPGGPLSFAMPPGMLEDTRTVFGIAPSSSEATFTADDFITLAWYDYAGSTPWDDSFALAAVDATPYHFSPTLPSTLPPSPPPGLDVGFDNFDMRIFTRWSSATDPDSPDSSVTYEINYTTSTDFNPAGWRAVGQAHEDAIDAVYGNSYQIAIRAKDDFGNLSAPATIDWQFPENYVPLPRQLDHSVEVGWADGASAQSFVSPGNATITTAYIWAKFYGYVVSWAYVYAELRTDQGGAPGDLIATTNLVGVPWQGGGVGETALTFSPPVALTAGTIYWLVPIRGPNPATDNVALHGSGVDAYASGTWSGAPGTDIYFRFRQE